jgi:hypothetical protein
VDKITFLSFISMASVIVFTGYYESRHPALRSFSVPQE